MYATSITDTGAFITVEWDPPPLMTESQILPKLNVTGATVKNSDFPGTVKDAWKGTININRNPKKEIRINFAGGGIWRWDPDILIPAEPSQPDQPCTGSMDRVRNADASTNLPSVKCKLPVNSGYQILFSGKFSMAKLPDGSDNNNYEEVCIKAFASYPPLSSDNKFHSDEVCTASNSVNTGNWAELEAHSTAGTVGTDGEARGWLRITQCERWFGNGTSATGRHATADSQCESYDKVQWKIQPE